MGAPSAAFSLDYEINRAAGETAESERAGTETAETETIEPGADISRALAALNEEWDESERNTDEPRTIIMRGYGPRWSERLDL